MATTWHNVCRVAMGERNAVLRRNHWSLLHIITSVSEHLSHQSNIDKWWVMVSEVYWLFFVIYKGSSPLRFELSPCPWLSELDTLTSRWARVPNNWRDNYRAPCTDDDDDDDDVDKCHIKTDKLSLWLFVSCELNKKHILISVFNCWILINNLVGLYNFNFSRSVMMVR